MTNYEWSYSEFSKNCKEYKKAGIELIKDLDSIAITDKETIIRRIDLFCDQYLMPFWWLRLDNRSVDDDFNLLHRKARYHFYFSYDHRVTHLYKNYDSPSIHSSGRYVGIYEIMLNFKPENIIYPHVGLEWDMKFIEKYSAAPINNGLIKKFEKALKIYDRIKEVKDGNDEEWLKRLQEWDDEEFIIQNIEFKIGSYLQQKKPGRKLWKLYIEYLRPNMPKAMLGVYSRYCRYFIDDKKMKKKFLAESGKLGVVVVPENEVLLDFQEFESFPEEAVLALKEPCKTTFSADSMMAQNFSLPDPMLHYLIKNTNFQVLQKLFSACKFFFKKQPTPICHRLAVVEKPQNIHPIQNQAQPQPSIIFNQQAVTIISDNVLEIKNLWITNYFFYNKNLLLPEILSCIYKFTVKYLSIENQNIALKDYTFMTESKTVQELNFANVRIFCENNILAHLEDVMETLSNAYHIDLIQTRGEFFPTNPITINSMTFEKLIKMPRKCKVQYLRFRGCNESLDPVSCFNFIKNNNKISDERSGFNILFVHNIDANFKKNCINVFNDLLKAYNNENENKICCRIGYRE